MPSPPRKASCVGDDGVSQEGSDTGAAEAKVKARLACGATGGTACRVCQRDFFFYAPDQLLNTTSTMHIGQGYTGEDANGGDAVVPDESDQGRVAAIVAVAGEFEKVKKQDTY